MRLPTIWGVLCRLWLAAALGLALAPSARAADLHQGVASCAGGICHASSQPLGNSGIRRDEYFIWQQRDPHARATATLGSERSRRIGAALETGEALGNPSYINSVFTDECDVAEERIPGDGRVSELFGDICQVAESSRFHRSFLGG